MPMVHGSFGSTGGRGNVHKTSRQRWNNSLVRSFGSYSVIPVMAVMS